MFPKTCREQDRRSKQAFCGLKFSFHFHLVPPVFNKWPGKLACKVLSTEFICIYRVPERRAEVQPDCRKVPHQQLKEYHTCLFLHIVGSMVDNKPVSFQEFTY